MPARAPSSVVLTIRLPAPLKRAVQQAARRDWRTANGYVVHVLRGATGLNTAGGAASKGP